jgi:hypothetical protein
MCPRAYPYSLDSGAHLRAGGPAEAGAGIASIRHKSAEA